MQVVCEATQSDHHPVQVGAFECLVKIMGLYYDKMGFYMERALFGVRARQYSLRSGIDSSTISSPLLV